jgi:hypothetical protein
VTKKWAGLERASKLWVDATGDRTPHFVGGTAFPVLGIRLVSGPGFELARGFHEGFRTP